MALFDQSWVSIQRRMASHPDHWFVKHHQYYLIAAVAILSTLFVYIPFLSSGSMEYVFRHWDGPNYAYLAKTMYDIPADHPLSFYTTPSYFAAHLPVYPFSIRIFSFLGYLNAMLFTTVLYATLAAIVLFKLLQETKVVRDPLWSAIISLFIPVRYLLNHSIGATEAPFLFFTLSSMLAYVRGQYILAFALGGISGITRITGILIGGAYFMMLVTERKWKYIPWLALVALPLFSTFTFYHFHYGDFFAYFGTNYSDSNKLINLNPFQLFRLYSAGGDTHSAEFYLIMYVIYGMGTALLWSRHKLFFWFCAVTFTFSIFIFHQDVSRYLIPMAPLALIVAYDDIFSRKEFKIMFIPALVLAYIYVWGMIPKNVVDLGNFRKLKAELEYNEADNTIKSAFEDVRVRACTYQQCASQIQSKKGGKTLGTQRGLNLYRYTTKGEIKFVKVYDHCAKDDIYEQAEPLNSFISNLPGDTEKVILVSNDTLVCNHRPLNGIKDWTRGLNLSKLNSVEFRETYIGMIDFKSKQTLEFKANETQTYPVE